jgi:hypothetical protein
VIEARHYVPLVYTAAAITLVVTLPFVPTSANATFWPLGAGTLAALCALALIPTAIGHTLVQRGARTLSPSLISLTSPGETLGSILISMALFAKSPTLVEAIGCGVILCGALAIRRRRPVGETENETGAETGHRKQGTGIENSTAFRIRRAVGAPRAFLFPVSCFLFGERSDDSLSRPPPARLQPPMGPSGLPLRRARRAARSR